MSGARRSPPGDAPGRFAHRQRLVLVVLVTAAVALVAAAILSVPHWTAILGAISNGDIARLRSQLAGLGPTAALALVALVLAHTVLPFPAEIVTAAAGFALGFELALPLLIVSFLASAVLAYLIGRCAARPVAAALVGADRLDTAERLMDRAGAKLLLVVRLCPLVPFSPVGLACGVIGVPLRRYVWTTVVGMAPELAIVAYLGTRLHSAHVTATAVLVPVGGAALVMLLGSSALARLRPAWERDHGG